MFFETSTKKQFGEILARMLSALKSLVLRLRTKASGAKCELLRADWGEKLFPPRKPQKFLRPLFFPRLFLLCFFFFNSLILNLFAEGFAIVDVSILLAFHPQMARYDFSVNRFFLPHINLQDANQIEIIHQEMQKCASESVKQIAEAKLHKLHAERELVRFDENSRKTLNKMLKEGKDIGPIERAFETQRNEFQKNFAEAERKFIECKNSELNLLYLSHEESSELFMKMISEIDEVLSDISKKYGNIAILDQSFLANPTSQTRKHRQEAGLNSLSSNLYHEMLSFDFSVPENFEGAPGKNERLRQGIEGRFQKDFQEYLSQTPSLRPLIDNARGRLFLVGGRDLTAEALTRILDSNGIRLEVRNRLVQMISQIKF